ncbi:MAG: hypothetical protein ACLFP1_04820 [Candidatus Goldiibacteriota bacterium]
MKKALFFILFIIMSGIMPGTGYADEYIEIFSLAGPDIRIPAADNVYGVLYGGGYGFYAVKDGFLAGTALRINTGAGKPAITEKHGIIYSSGIYPDEWSIEGKAESIGYLSVFFGIELGWKAAHFFKHRQFISLGFGWFGDREDFGGGEVFNSSRYMTSLSVMSEIGKIPGIDTYLKAEFSAVPKADMNQAGTGNFFTGISITGYISHNRQSKETGYKIKAPASDNEPEKEIQEHEDAVWEE